MGGVVSSGKIQQRFRILYMCKTHSSVKASHPPRATTRNAWIAVAATEKAPFEHPLTPITLRVCLRPRPIPRRGAITPSGVCRNACGEGPGTLSGRAESAMLNSRKFFPMLWVVSRYNLITDNPRSSPRVCAQEVIAAIAVCTRWIILGDWSRRVRRRSSPSKIWAACKARAPGWF